MVLHSFEAMKYWLEERVRRQKAEEQMKKNDTWKRTEELKDAEESFFIKHKSLIFEV